MNAPLFCRPARFYMVGRSGDWNGFGLLTTDTTLAPSLTPGLIHPFLRPGSLLSPREQRRRNLARAVSWVLVGILHVLVLIFFVISIRPFSDINRPITETILMLPTPGNNAPPLHLANPEIPNPNPPMILSAPITIPKPPPPPDVLEQPLKPGDVLGAVGQALACSAGSWEHLTGPERARCGGMPWRGMRLPNGSLVMVPPSQLPRLRDVPQSEFSVNSGADRIQRDLQNGQIPGQGGCPILQQIPCTHVSPGMRAMDGDN